MRSKESSAQLVAISINCVVVKVNTNHTHTQQTNTKLREGSTLIRKAQPNWTREVLLPSHLWPFPLRKETGTRRAKVVERQTRHGYSSSALGNRKLSKSHGGARIIQFMCLELTWAISVCCFLLLGGPHNRLERYCFGFVGGAWSRKVWAQFVS